MTFWDLFTTPSLHVTFGYLMKLQIGFFLIGVMIGILGSWIDKGLGKKVKTKILLCLLVLLAAGCASMQTEIIRDPGKIDSITVGHFTTANPVDNELIGSYLRKELAKRGFVVTDDSPYVLTGTIGFYDDLLRGTSRIRDASIVLKKDSGEQLVQWFYSPDTVKSVLLLGVDLKNRRDFACYMAQEITNTLRQ